MSPTKNLFKIKSSEMEMYAVLGMANPPPHPLYGNYHTRRSVKPRLALAASGRACNASLQLYQQPITALVEKKPTDRNIIERFNG